MTAQRDHARPEPEPGAVTSWSRFNAQTAAIVRAQVDGRNVGRRRKARPLVPGKRVPVRPEDVASRARLLAEIDRLKVQLTNVTHRLERQLGDAEYGTVDGADVIRREQSVTAGRYVRQNHRDDLRPV